VQWRGRGSSWLFYLRRGGLPHPHIDGLDLFFALLITSIGTLVLIEAGSYLAGHHHLGRFYIPTTSLDQNELENAANWPIFASDIVQIHGIKWPYSAQNRYIPDK
jgi:hypothetical protein